MSDYASEFAKSILGQSLRTARGTASAEAKEYVAGWYGAKGNSRQYIYPILSRMEATDVDVIEISEVPGKKQGRIMFEVDVQEGVYCTSCPSGRTPDHVANRHVQRLGQCSRRMLSSSD